LGAGDGVDGSTGAGVGALTDVRLGRWRRLRQTSDDGWCGGSQRWYRTGHLGRRRWIWRRPEMMWRWRPGRGAAADDDGEGG
jgi:hypothetical protein